MQYYFMAFKKYATTNERTTRKEFWHYVLIDMTICFFLGYVGGSLTYDNNHNSFINGASNIYLVVGFVPRLAILFRRMHDIGRSEWNLLLLFLPILGPLYLLYLSLLPSQPHDNKYGFYKRPVINESTKENNKHNNLNPNLHNNNSKMHNEFSNIKYDKANKTKNENITEHKEY